ncbi:EGF-like domain, Wall-associated receptor kinase, galacturonan-binding domain protein [Artemisia annua]|uniref:EGF-like domain, Wall-associated receptor kinase, galacturonan-binding domain protein n=1 Tax=Artemisia annua TaxID=35608 RepID=A0A2U1N4D7_ARTAN|nr:EGF-like domain, Wall-associated receptor kinase, galacturonan-binding domain protein [Artemisia annua]
MFADINECNDKSNFHCDGNCINTPGSYSCTCRPGYTGNATTPNGCQRDKGSNFPVMIFTLGNSLYYQVTINMSTLTLQKIPYGKSMYRLDYVDYHYTTP